jgi:hypothetical protein
MSPLKKKTQDDGAIPAATVEFSLDNFDIEKELEEFEKSANGIGIWDDLEIEDLPSSSPTKLIASKPLESKRPDHHASSPSKPQNGSSNDPFDFT